MNGGDCVVCKAMEMVKEPNQPTAIAATMREHGPCAVAMIIGMGLVSQAAIGTRLIGFCSLHIRAFVAVLEEMGVPHGKTAEGLGVFGDLPREGQVKN